MCYADGFVHADLHPGNMLVAENGELVIFDAGLCVEMGPETLIQMVDFARCVAMGTTKDFVGHLQRFHSYMDGVDWDEIEKDCAGFVARFRCQNIAELEMGEFINELFALARRHKVRPLPEVTLVFVGIVTAEGLSKMLDPDVNSFQEMAVFILPIVQKMGLLERSFEDWIRKAEPILAAERIDARS